jgi:methylated-DNA-[protein]-cysteine S-methyltransferase
MAYIFHDFFWGRFFLEEREGMLSSIRYIVKTGAVSDKCARSRVDAQYDESSPLLRETVRQIEAYSRGRLQCFNLPLFLQGTAFQKSVWTEIMRIPYGKTVSYGDIAMDIGNPRASRAVGMACHRNPLIIVIPCHRVLAAGKRLSGYIAGMNIKRQLLALEEEWNSDGAS